MGKLLRFRHSDRRQQTYARSRRTLPPSNSSSPKSSRLRRRAAVVAAASVFQQLALENPYGLRMLENLGRQMLEATKVIAGA